MSTYVIAVRRKGSDCGFIYKKSNKTPKKDIGNVWVTKNVSLCKKWHTRSDAVKYAMLIETLWRGLEFEIKTVNKVESERMKNEE